LAELREQPQIEVQSAPTTQSKIEYCKLWYDLYKHIGTFSVAAIAVFGAMLGGVFTRLGRTFVPNRFDLSILWLRYLSLRVSFSGDHTDRTKYRGRPSPKPARSWELGDGLLRGWGILVSLILHNHEPGAVNISEEGYRREL